MILFNATLSLHEDIDNKMFFLLLKQYIRHNLDAADGNLFESSAKLRAKV